MSEASDQRLYFPHVARNREPILDVLKRVLPRQGLALEIASGGGEHAAYFASNLPGLLWQPTDANAEMFESIAAHRAAALVSGHERDRGGDVAMGHRDAGIGEPADPGGDPGHDAKRNLRGGERQGLLAAAPEDAGVASLQPQHPVSLPGQMDQSRGDVGLARRRPAAALAGKFEDGAGPCQFEDARVDQRVVDHSVGIVERVQRQGREQPRIARPGADQPDAARRKIRQMETRAVDHEANLYKLDAER